MMAHSSPHALTACCCDAQHTSPSARNSPGLPQLQHVKTSRTWRYPFCCWLLLLMVPRGWLALDA